MEKFLRKAAGDVVVAVVAAKAWRAVKYVSPTQVVRATRVLWRKRIPRTVDIRLSVCRPNYREVRFIRDCKKAGVPFPVRKIQLQFPPKPRKK